MKWIDVNERLQEKNEDVLCIIEYIHGDYEPVIRWRSIYNDTITDENGFVIYPLNKRVVAWMPIPKYELKNIHNE